MSEFDLIYKLDLSKEETRKIVKDYGSVSEFCQRYIKFMQGDKTVKIKIPKSVENCLTNYYDLSNPYSLGENSGYARLVADILRIRPGFVSYGPLEDIVNSAMDEVLSEQDKDIVRALYNLDGKGRSVNDLEAIYDMNPKDILIRKQRSVKRISVGKKSGQLQLLSRLIVDSAIVDEVMPDFIEVGDAIAETDYDKHNERKLILVERILLKEIEYITFTGDLDYIFQGLQVKTKISNSILSDEKKRELLDNVDNQIRAIVEANKDKIVRAFQERINNFVHDDNEERRYKALRKDINNSGLDEESISILLNQLPEIKEKSNTTYGILKRDLILRIKFPQSELPVEQMGLRDKSTGILRKSDLTNVGKIIKYSKKELMNFASINGLHIADIFDELECIGFDIPDDDTVPIEIYNHDKIHEDSFSKMAEDIQESTLDRESKSILMDMVLKGMIEKLEQEHERLERLIRTYTDIFRTHEHAKLETADEERYRRKVKEAEEQREKIKKQIEEFGR